MLDAELLQLQPQGKPGHTQQETPPPPQCPAQSGQKVRAQSQAQQQETRKRRAPTKKRPPIRPTGAVGTVTGARRSADGTTTPGGGSATSGDASGNAGVATSANGTSTASPTESPSTRERREILFSEQGLLERPQPQSTQHPDAQTGHTENMSVIARHSTSRHRIPEAGLKMECLSAGASRGYECWSAYP
ncbi:ataxin-2 homolog [Procambarus clarkii]|uniref:ataxin-2 homolog n=1 Tax=Procambarus clarkii TaxID=6728 RepID=UPI003741FBE8